MKNIIHIHTKDGKTIYRGSMIHMPFKKRAIEKACIDLFNDPDPCIIHQSYAVSHFVEIMEKRYLDHPVLNLSLKDEIDTLHFLDIPDLEQLFLTVEVNS